MSRIPKIDHNVLKSSSHELESQGLNNQRFVYLSLKQIGSKYSVEVNLKAKVNINKCKLLSMGNLHLFQFCEQLYKCIYLNLRKKKRFH